MGGAASLGLRGDSDRSPQLGPNGYRVPVPVVPAGGVTFFVLAVTRFVGVGSSVGCLILGSADDTRFCC
jgi:hypothetical protein